METNFMIDVLEMTLISMQFPFKSLGNHRIVSNL
jgi:hypothetical protein